MVDNLAPVKVKGLLKGLRYISQIFDGEKEQEMVIGNPTDVKHVAHIGWEGPSASKNEFNTSSFGQDGKEFGSADAQEIPHGVAFSPSREKGGSPKPRRTRHHSTSTETATTDGGTKESHGTSSHRSRKSRSSDSQSQEGHKSRHHKHHSKHQSSASASGSESTSQEVPKKSRKKERRRKGSDSPDEKDEKVTEEAF